MLCFEQSGRPSSCATSLTFEELNAFVVRGVAFFALLVIIVRGYKWEEAPEGALKQGYFPYELCVINLPPSKYVHNISILAQPACLHLLQHDFLKNLPQRCWFGAKQQRQDNGICVGSKGGQVVFPKSKQVCFSLQERKGVYKHWSGLPTDVNPISEFANAVLDRGFELSSFLGDSMTLQTSQRLLCSALRKNMSVTLYSNYFSMPPRGASAKIDLIPLNRSPSKTRSLMVWGFRLSNGLGCTDLDERKKGSIKGAVKACNGTSNSTCIKDFKANYIYKRTTDEFKKALVWGNTLLIVIIPVRVKNLWENIPFARAIVEVADLVRGKNSSVLMVSPLAQHFLSHRYGIYDNFTKPKPDIMPCGPHRSEIIEHPYAIDLKSALKTIKPDWHKYIGFFNSAPYTAPMFDLHSETHSTGFSVDCTHYFYQPFMFDAFWMDIAAFIRKPSYWNRGILSI